MRARLCPLHDLVGRRQAVRRLRIGPAAGKDGGEVVRAADLHDLLGLAIEPLQLVVLSDPVQALRPEVVGMQAGRVGEPAVGAAAVTDGEVPDLVGLVAKRRGRRDVRIALVRQLVVMTLVDTPFEHENPERRPQLDGLLDEEERSETRPDDDVADRCERTLGNERHPLFPSGIGEGHGQMFWKGEDRPALGMHTGPGSVVLWQQRVRRSPARRRRVLARTRRANELASSSRLVESYL